MDNILPFSFSLSYTGPKVLLYLFKNVYLLSVSVSIQVSDAYIKVLSIIVFFSHNFSFLDIFLFLKNVCSMKYVLLAFFIVSHKPIWWLSFSLIITPRYLKFLESLGLGNSSTSTISPDCTVGICLLPKMEKNHRGNAFIPVKMFEMKPRNGYLPRMHFFLKDLPYWYTAMTSVWTDLVIMCRSKANLTLCHSIMSYSLCCYLFI